MGFSYFALYLYASLDIMPTPKRVLFITHHSGLAGSGISLYTLLKGLNGAKYKAYIILPMRGPLVTLLKELKLKIFFMPQSRWVGKLGTLIGFIIHSPFRLIRLIRFIKTEKIDLVYSNTEMSPLGALAAYFVGIPHVWHIRSYPTYHQDIKLIQLPHKLFFTSILYLSKYVVVNSVAVASQFKSLDKNRKVHLVYNGVCLEREPASTSVGLKLWDSGKNIDIRNIGDNLVGVIGYICEYRRQHDCIYALREILEHITDLKMLIIGEADRKYLSNLFKIASNLGVQNNVFFCKTTVDIQTVMARCSLIIAPGKDGAYCRTTMEAMGLGIPVVASDFAAHDKVLINGVNGYFYHFGDSHDLTTKCLLILRDKNLRAEMSKNAKMHIEKYFTAKKHVQEIEMILDKVWCA